MKLQTIVVATLAAAFVIGSAGISEAKKGKKAKAAAPAAACQWWYVPVCGMKGKVKTNYDNTCWAKQAGAKKIKAGRCS